MSVCEKDDYSGTIADPGSLVSANDASRIIGIAHSTLKQSRYTGKLFGRAAPKFVRHGRLVRYRRAEIAGFLAQFDEYQNTAEANSKERGASS